MHVLFQIWVSRTIFLENFHDIFKCIELCLSFFGGAGDDGDAAVWKALLAGERRVPMPVYLLGPNSQERKMTECTILLPQ